MLLFSALIILIIYITIKTSSSTPLSKEHDPNAKRVKGVIYEYVPTGFYVGDAWIYNFLVRYKDELGNVKQTVVKYGKRDLSKYPIGGVIEFYLQEGRPGVLISESAMPGESGNFEFMNDPGYDVGYVKGESISCPNCGASVIVAKGYSVKCPYCGQAVTNQNTVSIRQEEWNDTDSEPLINMCYRLLFFAPVDERQDNIFSAEFKDAFNLFKNSQNFQCLPARVESIREQEYDEYYSSTEVHKCKIYYISIEFDLDNVEYHVKNIPTRYNNIHTGGKVFFFYNTDMKNLYFIGMKETYRREPIFAFL